MARAVLFLILSAWTISDLRAEVSDTCRRWFTDTGAKPKTESCETKCGTADVGLGTFHCTSQCAVLCQSSHDKVPAGEEREEDPCGKLKGEAKRQLAGGNSCVAFASVVRLAAARARKQERPAKAMVEELKRLLIGEDLLDNRGTGPCYAGGLRGAVGFRPELRDKGNQIQHAMAGIWVGYHFGWLGCAFVKWREREPQDDRLYDIACPLGRQLNDSNYGQLADRIRQQIGDDSCQEPLDGRRGR